MTRYRTIFCIILLTCLTGPSSYAQAPFGEVSVRGGPIYPQGNYARYTDVGGGGTIRANGHFTEAQPISLFLEVSGNIYSSNSTPAAFTLDGIAIPVKKNESEYNLALHLGIQFGTGSRNGFLRPRVSIGPGLYLFNTETSYRPLDYDETLLTNDDTQLRVGWRASVGSAFFFSPKWGVSFDFVYDHVVSLHRALDADEFGRVDSDSRPGRFQSYMIGVIIPFETMEE